jgi:hypothetical protein
VADVRDQVMDPSGASSALVSSPDQAPVLQEENQVNDPGDNETLFSRSQPPVHGATIPTSDYTLVMSNLSKATEKLLGIAEQLAQ